MLTPISMSYSLKTSLISMGSHAQGPYMADTSTQQQFGLVMAYLLPGFTGLAGLAPLLPQVNEWLLPVSQEGLGFGPPIYALLLATSVGLIVSCVRWLVIDHLLERLGIPKAIKDYEKLPQVLETYDYLINVHYRYYQFYSNSVISILFAYLPNRLLGTMSLLGLGTDLGVFVVCAVLLLGARDALTKYRKKLIHILDA